MCGFLGKISISPTELNQFETANVDTICRGPDSKKVIEFSLKNFFHTYVFNRLSILDLSPKADQPMVDDINDNLIMFNGEIYNHSELRDYLIEKGCTFKTSHSDTEVLLKGLSQEGIDFVNKLRGQFSIFFLDKTKNKALLIRDRVGQKPFYYKLNKEELIFGSNLNSILKLSGNKEIISKDSLNEYLKYGAVSSPNTVFEEIYKIPPGCYLQINFDNDTIFSTQEEYWSIFEKVNNKPFNRDEFWKIFNDAVNLRSIADVPIANFLSGGLDSSTVVKAQSENKNSLNTFTVNIENKKYDDSHWAEIVAKKYNTNHNAVSVSNYLEIDNIEKILSLIDEPYADPSVIPSFVISKEISKFYKVAISGDGGDELLGGYIRTGVAIKNKNNFRNLISKIYKIYPAILGTGNILLRNSKEIELSYKSFLEDNKLLKLLGINANSVKDNLVLNKSFGNLKALLFAEYKFYLPEMMMFKIDRTSMANSLEVRSPFVDHVLIEYIISHDFDYEPNNAKKILKEYLLDDFGKDFVNRKKQGFIFDLENFIYSNINYIESRIIKGKLKDYYKLKKIKYLKIKKSRINANRLWKLYVMTLYLEKFNS